MSFWWNGQDILVEILVGDRRRFPVGAGNDNFMESDNFAFRIAYCLSSLADNDLFKKTFNNRFLLAK